MKAFEHFVRTLQDPLIFERIATTSTALSASAMLISPFYCVKYGKTYKVGKRKYEMPDRPAFIMAHSSGPLIFFYTFYLYKNQEQFLHIPPILYLIHNFHRLVIYPMFRSDDSKPWPIETILFYWIINLLNGYTLSHLLIFIPRQMHIIWQITLSILFLATTVFCAIHDYILCELRAPGSSGYRIPTGLLFNFISCPNYALEIIQWTIFAFFLTPSLGSVSFLLWTYSNLIGRAESVQDAYIKLFRSKYPDDRTALFPFFLGGPRRRLIDFMKRQIGKPVNY